MKRDIFTKIITATMIMSVMVTVSANNVSAADASTVGTTVAVTGAAVKEAYEGSVIARMAGRAGAAVPKGAKGISFEIMYCDMKNAVAVFKDGTKTALSKSSVDQVADLVTTAKDGAVVELIQCKNAISESGVKQIIAQIESGQYLDTTLVTTKESAEVLSKALTEKNIAYEIVNSGIDSNTTIKIANKSLGKVSTEAVKGAAGKTGAIGAGIGGAVALYESYKNGDTTSDIVGNVITEASVSGVSGAAAGVAGELVATGLGAAGISGAASVAVPLVVVIGTGALASYGLDKVAESTDLKDKISDIAENVGNKSKELYASAKDSVSSKIADIRN